jgi:tRNA-dihydrouridine synthase B
MNILTNQFTLSIKEKPGASKGDRNCEKKLASHAIFYGNHIRIFNNSPMNLADTDNTTMLYLAPIRGITDLVYRNAFAQHFQGIDRAVAPFVATLKGDQVKASHLRECHPEQNHLPTVPQIIGKNPDHFIELARQLAELGNQEVNWNLGCPYPTMTKKRCGAGLLPHAQDIDRFLDTVCSKSPIRLSVKMRLGLCCSEEGTAILPVLNRYPLKEVIIHPRLASQMYKGPIDLDAFARCCEDLKHPVVYSGDLGTPADVLHLRQRFPTIQGWMLGRGLLANPFLPEEIRQTTALTTDRKRARLKAFHDSLLKGYIQRLSGPTHQLQRLCSLWEYLQHSVPNGNRLLRKIKKMSTLSNYHLLVESWF